jgi:tetratricopeptide (TPR) repeat protein
MTKAGMGLTGAAGAAAAGAMLAKRDEEEEIFAEEAESERPAPASDSGASLMEEPTPSSGEDELPDWLLETVAAGPASDAEAPSEVLPEWLTGSGAEQAQLASEPDASGLAPLGPAAAAAAMAASLGGERAQPQEQPEGENETLAGEPASDLSNWLASLDQEDEAKVQEPAQAGGETQIAETVLEAGMAVETAEETPAETAAQSALQDGEAALEAPAMAGSPRAGEVTPEDVAQMSEDDAFAWLESLAAKQGVDPNQLLTRPEEPSETTPEWLSQPEIDRNTETPGSAATIFAAAAVGEMLSPEDEPAEAAPEPQKAEASGAGDMDWLEGIEQEKITGELEAQTPMASEWLPMESAAEGAAPSVPELPREENGEEDAPPLASEPTAEESADAESPTQPQAEEEMPDWMRTSLEETPSRPMEEGVPEWMKASDEAQPSAEEEAETSVLEAEVAAAESSPAGPESGIEIARRTPPEEDDAIFEQAQIDLQRGDLEQATLGYKRLIRKGKLLDEVIFELREGTYQHPVDVVIWLTLGDAYRRANRLQEALDAYTKAEELLR